MRYLNKIAFINSAAARYAEILLDGNVHFIGTQGVGKSTVLRAILFFYNADTLKLGISREKKGFAEYYLPYANSYIVYEVIKETGPYCVFAFKSQGKVCFRFFDAAYDEALFIDGNGLAHESPDKIRAALDQKGVHLSRKIDRYEEYRDILYGNNEGKKDLAKYALLESKNYQNIPRTIQNVFLNSRLEAEFIKDTIIMSMNEEPFEVDLKLYDHHLKGFEAQLKDIRQFRHPAVVKQADNVRTFFHAIKYMAREKAQLATSLGWALEQATKAQPKMEESLQKEDTAKMKWFEKLENLKSLFHKKRDKIKGEMEVLKKKLDEAREKEEDYQQKNIVQVIERVSQKQVLDAEHADLAKERELLSAQYMTIVARYEALAKEINNQLAAYENGREADKNKLESTYQALREQMAATYQGLIEETRNQHTQKLKDLAEALEHKKQAVQALKIKRVEIKHKRYYEALLSQLETDINRYKQRVQRLENEILANTGHAETLFTQWGLEKDARQESHARQVEKVSEKMAILETETTAIAQKIANSQESLYGWLHAQYPGWEHTIGKVVDEALLFRNDLLPRLQKTTDPNLFGVELDMDEIIGTVKTVADYEHEKEGKTQQISALKEEAGHLEVTLLADVEKLKKKYHTRIKAHKDQIKEGEVELEQSKTALDLVAIQMTDQTKKAADEKKTALEDIDTAMAKAAEEEVEAREKLVGMEDALNKQVKAKLKERDKKIEEASAEKQKKMAAIDTETANARAAAAQRITETDRARAEELVDSGADTHRIREIEDRQAVLRAELRFIENNRDRVADYKKDKRELFDRVDEFKNKKQILEQSLLQEDLKYNQQEHNIQRELENIQGRTGEIQRELDKILEDLEAFDKFRETQPEKYNDIETWLAGAAKTENKTAKRARELIDDIIAIYYKRMERMSDLKKEVNRFLGNFSSQNIFNFNTGITEDEDYMAFASDFSDFMEEDKLTEFEKRVNERYADIIKLIGRETGDLTSKEGEIQNVITKINKDFQEKNFVGVIKKIELKLEESTNPVVVMLKAIKNFNDENRDDLGAANLFSSQDKDAKNQKAIDLLKQLIKEISDFKRDDISLSDSFELKFRIEENQNDTGWVEKLSNVGSEGTDILVKAMVNIMLLNVFKETASKRFKDFRLHCVMDEIGRLHPGNVRGILKFANDRNILLINGSPTENDALAYRHIYKLRKDEQSVTRVNRIMSKAQQELE